MNDNIYVIYCHPLQVFHALVAIGDLFAFLSYVLLHKIRDCPDLRLIVCFTDYEKIRNSLRYLAQIKRNYVLSFFLLNCVDNSFNDLRTLR